MDALILVDLQNDFMPGGALAVRDGDAVVAIANRLIPGFKLVVATQDYHPKAHQSFASQHPQQAIGDVIDLHGLGQVLWPEHCVQNTHGAEFHSALNTQGISKIFSKGGNVTVDSYSGFFDNGKRYSTGLASYLESQKVKRVFVMGLSTDYCVKFTAIDAAELGFSTHLILDGCRGVELNTGDIDRALNEMKSKGITLIQSAGIPGR